MEMWQKQVQISKENDELIIRFGQKLVTVKVTGLSDHATKEMQKVCMI